MIAKKIPDTDMLKLQNITKSFTGRGIVLDKLEISVEKGDSIAVTGPSGSGKTTLMNIMSLLDRPDSGDVHFNGKSILSFNPDEAAFYRNKNLGFVFQDHLLFPHLSIKENILLPVFASEISKKEFLEKEAWCQLLMKQTGITDFSGSTLSSEEKHSATL
jgi:ABC-type lipoprotein export system ATPase subunit